MNLAKRTSSLADALVREYFQAPNLFGEIARIETMLADTYRNRVQYELLQNSDDAGSTTVHISRPRLGMLRWENNGRDMTEQDVEALCRSATSAKSRGEDIGYRGIGFKSIAAIASKIDVESGGVKFTFDSRSTVKLLGVDTQASVPLVRIPTDVATSNFRGARFSIELSVAEPDLRIDPTALLFLRSVERVESSLEETSSIVMTRTSGRVKLSDDGASGEFALLEATGAQLAIPLDPWARKIAGPAGRLACFLPLDESMGLPIVLSGDIATDPSRTNAILDDASTKKVIAAGAELFAEVIRNPYHPIFDVAWQLLLEAPDPRAALLGSMESVASIFFRYLRENLSNVPIPFAIAPVSLVDAETEVLFPGGAPNVLYASQNRVAVRALKAALNLPELSLEDVAGRLNPEAMPLDRRSYFAKLLAENARLRGRQMTSIELAFGAHGESLDVENNVHMSVKSATVNARTSADVDATGGLPYFVERWRAIEVAVVEWLNSRGWSLTDVSKQNLGYDAEGLDGAGRAVCLEIKKTDGLDSSFALTTNEWALAQSGIKLFLLAVVIGDGRRSRMALLDPIGAKMEPIRVARQWEWRFENWSEHALWVQ